MERVRVFLSKIIDNGSSPEYDFQKNKRIKLSNQIYLTVMVYYIPFAILNLIYSYYQVFALVSFNLFICLICLYLTGKHKVNQSNGLFLHVVIIVLFLSYIMVGLESRLDVLLIAVVSGIYTIYGNKMIRQVVYYTCLCALSYAGMQLLDSHHFQVIINADPSYLSFIKLASFAVSSVACVLIPLLFDIENKKREAKLSKAKEEMEVLLRKKTTFFSMMNHEIRTPLHGIIGLSELLTESKDVPTKMKEQLNVINFSAKNLKNIVSDVLDYSKLEDGRLTISKHPFNLHNLIKDVDSVQRMRVVKKGLTFNKKISQQLPEFVDSDPYRLTQVLNNLIDNAIKFTDVGSVSLKVVFEEQGGNKGLLNFEVADTGVGIALEAQEDLFSVYSQVSSVSSRNFQGTGLGLAICKNIVLQLDGTVELISKEHEGTLVKFSLPVNVFHPEVLTEDSFLSEDDVNVSALIDLKILQVEDNLINQFVCEEVFESLGIVFKIVDDGRKAIDLLKTTSFDIIIMDYHMPGMDGYEVSREVRRQESELNMAETPILIATADLEGVKRANYIENGINGHISKPFSKKELLITLQGYCNEFDVKLDKTEKQEHFCDVEIHGAQIDVEFVKTIIGNDDDIVDELISMVKKSVPKYIQGINKYRNNEDFSDNDYNDVITKVHNLKSNFKNVGAIGFFDILQQVETSLRETKDLDILWEGMSLIEQNIGLLDTEKK